MSDDVALFPERDDAGRILVWRLVARGVARWSCEHDALFEEGRHLACEHRVSLCLVTDADSRYGELIDSYRLGPWRRAHGHQRWTASVFRIGIRFTASVVFPDGRMKVVNTFDSLLDAMHAADEAIPAHDCPNACRPWDAKS